MQGPAALAVQRQNDVMEGHERRAVADGDAGAAQLLHHLAEPLLHVHLSGPSRHCTPLVCYTPSVYLLVCYVFDKHFKLAFQFSHLRHCTGQEISTCCGLPV